MSKPHLVPDIWGTVCTSFLPNTRMIKPSRDVEENTPDKTIKWIQYVQFHYRCQTVCLRKWCKQKVLMNSFGLRILVLDESGFNKASRRRQMQSFNKGLETPQTVIWNFKSPDGEIVHPSVFNWNCLPLVENVMRLIRRLNFKVLVLVLFDLVKLTNVCRHPDLKPC